MSKIQSLETEIRSIEAELVKLRHEREELEQSFSIPTGGKPSEVAIAAKQSAVALAERQPQLIGVSNAIALLEQQLSSKQSVFAQLKAQLKTEQDQLERVERLKVDRAKIQDQAEKIHDLATLLETAFWELKKLHQEFNTDYRVLNPCEPGSYADLQAKLIDFQNLQVPILSEKGNRFILSGRVIDLFRPERERAQAERTEKARTRNERVEDQWVIIQQQQAIQQHLEQQRQKAGILSQKQSELKVAEARKLEFESWGGMDTRGIKGVIEGLKFEIKELESQIDA